MLADWSGTPPWCDRPAVRATVQQALATLFSNVQRHAESGRALEAFPGTAPGLPGAAPPRVLPLGDTLSAIVATLPDDGDSSQP